ncbi:MAG: hypothetical protein HC846_13835, partial [Blastocatellia bacterium]|nr:hypothetical protein [Blastocatellia bacterium]
DFFLSWSAQTNYGFGDIGLRFYPPLAHYLLAFTQIFTNDWQTTSWINILFWMLVGSIGIYFFARHWLSPQNALLVGMLYAFAPYHLSQIYQYFLYSEFAAAGILPFCFLFVTKVNCEGKVQNVLLLGFFSGLLILTHIPTTIIGTICLSLYSIIILDWKNKEKVIPRFIFSGLIALLLTSFYWIKLITEMNWVNHIDQKFSAAGYYNYKSAFFPFFSTVNELYFVKQMWFRDIVGILTYLLLVPIFIYLITSIIKPKTPKKRISEFFLPLHFWRLLCPRT